MFKKCMYLSEVINGNDVQDEEIKQELTNTLIAFKVLADVKPILVRLKKVSSL